MNRSEIKRGNWYDNGKGRYRYIVDEGPHCRLYEGQRDADCVRYISLATRKSGLEFVTDTYTGEVTRNTTRASFASWARAKTSSTEHLDRIAHDVIKLATEQES